jgi:2,3-bisphosphoglycerate-independent phosphoglycerate mutase
MDGFELVKDLSESTPSKIVMLVIDGLGGLPGPATGMTELETARTPNLDKLAFSGSCGLTRPVGPGITPGSAPGHLALFGYNPVRYAIGRGVLEALGIDFELLPGDIAARGNFCTIDEQGLITDRRAGRISTEQSKQLCRLLDGQEIHGVTIMVRPVKEHRFVLVLRGSGLDQQVSDTDPQSTGIEPGRAIALIPAAQHTADIVNSFLSGARNILSGHHPANMVLLRGFSKRPDFPAFGDIYRLNPAAIAAYPMYRGLARVVGMTLLPTGTKPADEIDTLEKSFRDYDFFFVHLKGADAAGEDGDFERKVAVIEESDSLIPRITRLQPDVLVVAGDHSTPAVLGGHSWHEVPLLLSSPWCRGDRTAEFGESSCLKGSIGVIPAVDVMPLAMAHARKLKKYGA